MADPRDFLAAWGWQDAQCHLIAQRENRVYRVETPSGPVALRLHRPGYRTRDELQSELNWMLALSDRGLHVPAPLRTLQGRVCVAVGECVADVLTWMDGEPAGVDGALVDMTDPIGFYRATGAEIARLHDASDAWRPPEGFTRPAWDVDGLIGEVPLWGRFWDNPLLSSVGRKLLEQARETARSDLAALEGQLDYGLIHADIVPENVLISASGPTFIDFDDGGWGYRAFELATATNRAMREDSSGTLKSALLEGYSAHRAFDLDQLALFEMLRSFTYVGWIAARLTEPGAQARATRFIELALKHAQGYLGSNGVRG